MFEKIFKAYRPFLIIVLLLLSGSGIFTFINLPKEAYPEINLPFFNITATYPGADSETIEGQVIQKIEDKISSVKNVSTYSSVSSTNVGVISVEFERGTDKGTAYNDLKSAVDEAQSDMPDGVTNILIKKADTQDTPIYTFSIVGDYYPSILYDKVDYIEDDLKKISGVDKVTVIGSYTKEVEIEFDYDKLNKYNLSLPNIVGIISNYIDQSPVDKKYLNGNLYTFEVRTYDKNGNNLDNNLENFQQFLTDLPLVNNNGNILKLSDIANINITHPFYQRTSYINGKNAVKFMIYKVPGADILEVINSVKSYLNQKSTTFENDGVTSVEVFSQEVEINKTFDAFLEGFRDTSILIIIIATIFLGFRGALAVTITFPIVYLLTFIILKEADYTFNNIVSGALNLSLGIMVDNLIVVAQGFQDGIRKKMNKYEAILHSIKIYFKPLIVGNLITIGVFFPLGFMISGKIGEFIKFLPVTVTLTLLFSILVAFVFLPLILSFMKFDVEKKGPNIEHYFEKFNRPFVKFYKFVLRNPWKPIIFFYFLFATVIFLFGKFGSVDFMEMTDKDNIYLNIKYNNNISVEENKKYTSTIYDYVNDYFEANHTGVLKNTEISLGTQFSTSNLDNVVYNSSFNPDLALINLILTKTDDRDESDNALTIYPDLKSFLDDKIASNLELSNNLTDLSVFVQKNGLGGGKDISFNLSLSGSASDDELSILGEEYEKLLPKFKNISGTYGWTSSLEYTNGKVKIVYDLDKISQLNLSITELNTLIYGIYQKTDSTNYLTDYKGNGISISSLGDFGDDIIPVKGFIDYDIGENKNLDLSDLIIPGTSIYFKDIIKSITIEPEIKTFQHLDGDFVINIQSNKEPEVSLGTVQTAIDEIGNNNSNVKIVYGADLKDMAQSSKDLGTSFLVGFFLMFAIFVFNFKNFKQSFVLLGTIPLFLTGALFFLLISGKAMSFMVGIGLFGLIGVGLAHIIYLVNRFNELLEEDNNLTLDEMIIESVKSRLEPVFLTTVITSIGLFVLAFSNDFWTAFALSFAGGLILGTTITLVFIPSTLKLLYKNFKKEL